MTSFHKELHICPRCQNEEEIVIWDKIAATEDPDLIERLLKKELHCFECPNCGEQLTVSENVVILNDKEQYQICLLKELQTLSEQEQTALLENFNRLHDQHFAKNARLRVVGTLNELIEKIHIFSNQLDDVKLEIFKVALRKQYETEEHIYIEAMHFLSMGTDILVFQVKQSDGWYTLEIERKMYEKATVILGDLIQCKLGIWQQINEAFAVDCINRLTKMEDQFGE